MEFERRDMVVGMLGLPLLMTGCAGARGVSAPGRSALYPLSVYGAKGVVELAPVLLAVRDIFPAGTVVHPGGAANLVSADNVADVATNAETQALRFSARRPDMRIIMTVAEGLYRIVARRSAGISSVADLRGKRVATLTLTSAGYFLSRMLAREGMSIADVTIVQPMPIPAMVTAIANREADAIAMWEPHSENAVHALGDDAVEFSGAGVYRELFNLNSTAGALADPDKRRAIVALVRAIMDATSAMNRNPAQAQAMVVQAGGYTPEEVARCWKHQAFTAGFADDMLDVMTQEEQWLAEREGRPARSRADLAPLIDRSVYEEARALRS